MRRRVLLLIGALLLAACAPAAGDPGDPAAPPATPVDAPVDEGGTLTGTLAGDAGLEGGCAWLETADGRFEVVYPDGFQVVFDPLRLEGPDGAVVALEGEEVTVEGEESTDLVSICQVGPLFTATAVQTG